MDAVNALTVNAACYLACQAHAGQVDKAGRPYILHVVRVAERCGDDPLAEAVAWLHDVIEDAPDFADQVERDFPREVSWRVYALTRDGHIPVAEYYAGIAADPVCLRVKLADIADNADPQRLALLDDATAVRLTRKYQRARELLTQGAAG